VAGVHLLHDHVAFIRDVPVVQLLSSPSASSPLPPIGLALCVIGVVAAVYFFAVFDTSVEVPEQKIAGQTWVVDVFKILA
jgi:hypothetical protein